MADLLCRGVPRKDWLDAHIERVPLWEQAASRGTSHGLLMTGLCHWFGIGREVDNDAARPFFEKAADKGEPQAQFSLAQLILLKAREGEGPETVEDAYRWFMASAKSGLAQAQFSVAAALWKGEGIKEDEKEALEWMKKAAKQGHGQAAFTLADLHLTNKPLAGIKKDRATAIEWGRLAAAAGNKEAESWLVKYENGVVLTTDIAEQIFEHWKTNSDRHGPRSRTVGMGIGGDDSEDDDSPPAPAGPFADPPGTITNSIGMKLVPIPAGEFLMGSAEDCPLGDPSEEFQHRVRITKPFFMGMHQVTQQQYKQITASNPSHFPISREVFSGGHEALTAVLEGTGEEFIHSKRDEEGDNLPVEHLTWKDARLFCELLSQLPEERAAGRQYRLPTEAEWEYSCRAGTTTPFNTGDELEPHQARFSSTSRSSPKQTAAVGTYQPNAWGLFDMHGNVWEWTSDWFSADYFRESPVDDPQGPATGTHHTLRGGSASVNVQECRTTIRGESPTDGPDGNGQRFPLYGDFGVRVVCEASTVAADEPDGAIHHRVGPTLFDLKTEIVAPLNHLRKQLCELTTKDTATCILPAVLIPLAKDGVGHPLIMLSLISDLLRIVRDAIYADDSLSMEEEGFVAPITWGLMNQMAKYRKEYAPVVAAPQRKLNDALEIYSGDTKAFGYACSATKWAGAVICRQAGLLSSTLPAGDDYLAILRKLVTAILSVDEKSENDFRLRRDALLGEVVAIVMQGAKPKNVTNSFVMEFISIPAGSFTMGSPETEEGRGDDEKQVPVTITQAFELGKTVVTQKQWTEVMGTTPWKDEASAMPEGDNYPAVYVSWYDATKFCEKLTALEQ